MIHAALRAVAAFVDERASDVAWDSHHRPSDGQRHAKGQKVRTIAAELRELADTSETRMVRYAEYAALKDRLYAFGLSLTPSLDQGVATAIHGAQGPARPRDRGWLRVS